MVFIKFDHLTSNKKRRPPEVMKPRYNRSAPTEKPARLDMMSEDFNIQTPQ